MLDALNSIKDAKSHAIVAAMKKSVDEFTGDAPQFDDITMINLQYFGNVDELVIDAKIEKLDDVIAFVEQHLEQWECPMKIMTQIDIAVENEGKAYISMELIGREVEIVFKDSGVPYDPLAKPDPDVTLSAEEREIGGLGIYMVKKSMTSLSYEYRDGNNILTIRKYFE